MRQLWSNTPLFRFVVIGGLNTAFVYAIYAFFIFIGAGYVLALFISLLFGLVSGFKAHGKFVFHGKGRFYRYVISWIFLYLVNVGMLALLTSYGMSSYLAGAVAMPPMALLSFIVLRWLVFRPSNPARHGTSGST